MDFGPRYFVFICANQSYEFRYLELGFPEIRTVRQNSAHIVSEFNEKRKTFVILSFRRVLYVICCLLGNSPASEF